MNVYLGYKYKHNKDKILLKTNLEKISKKIQELNHNCFILGRDVHSWNINHVATSKSILPIIKNIRESDILFVFIDHPGESLGLKLETLFAKIFNKKIVLSIKNGLSENYFRMFSKDQIEFNDIEDLLIKIQNYFTK